MSQQYLLESPSLLSQIPTTVVRTTVFPVSPFIDSLVPRTPNINRNNITSDQCVPCTPTECTASTFSNTSVVTVAAVGLSAVYSNNVRRDRQETHESLNNTDQQVPSPPQRVDLHSRQDVENDSPCATIQAGSSVMANSLPMSEPEVPVRDGAAGSFRRQLSLGRRRDDLRRTAHQNLEIAGTPGTQSQYSQGHGIRPSYHVPSSSSSEEVPTARLSSPRSQSNHSSALSNLSTLSEVPYVSTINTIFNMCHPLPEVFLMPSREEITRRRRPQMFSHTQETFSEGLIVGLPHCRNNQIELFEGDDVFC